MIHRPSRRNDSPPGREQRTVFSRRLGAMLYDGLAVITLWLFATPLAMVFSGGEAIAPGNGLYSLYLLLIGYLYFACSWCRAGQTLGMRAWHIYGVQLNGDLMSWSQSTVRFICAILSWFPLGMGYLWSVFNKERLTWHDSWSGTRLITRLTGSSSHPPHQHNASQEGD